MIKKSTLRKGVLVFIVVLTCLPAISQIKPEITLGLRYNSDVLFRTTHDNHPFAIEAGGGINYNDKWYTGANFNYFRTKSSITDAKHYLIEIELRRSFAFKPLPKIGFNLSFHPGYILIDASSISSSTQLELYKTMIISASAGVSYSFSDHFKFYVRPGITMLPQEKSGITGKPRIGFFFGTSLTYKF
jgi:hypothetical protein